MYPITPPSRRRSRWVLLTIALLPIALLALGEALGWRFLRVPAENFLTQKLERPVRLGEPFRLHLLGGVSLGAGRVWIGAPPGFDVPHLVDARNLKLELRYRDLWNSSRTQALRIAGLSAGQLDAQLIQRPPLGATWRLAEQGDEPAQARPLPSVDGLAVTRGRLVLRDPLIQADLQASFSTQEGNGQAAPISRLEARGEFRGRSFHGILTTRGLLPVAAQAAHSQPPPARGWLEYGGVRVDFDGQLADLYGRRAVNGAVAIKGPSLAVLGRLIDTPLPTTGRFSITGTINRDGEVWHADVTRAWVGKSDLNGRFVYDPRPMRPLLTGELGGRRFVLADLAPAFGTRSEDGELIKPPSGRALPRRQLDLDSLDKVDARIAVNLDRVDLGNDFSLPITPFKGYLTLADGRLALSDAYARTAKGRLMGDFSLDARTDPPQWRTNLAWDGIRLEDWLKVAKEREQADKAAPPYFSGTLYGRAKLTGSGHSTAELLGSLDGAARATVREGRFSHLLIEILGLDVAQGLGLYLKGDDVQPVTCAVLDLKARRGQVKQVAWIDTPVTLLRSEGTVDLARENLDLRLIAKPRNFSLLTLRSPIRVQGPFAAPHATPEPGPIAARVLGGAALYSLAPPAVLLPFLDPGTRAERPC
jgi:AsmA family protein